MIRVVIADDQELVREGLRMMLQAEDDISVVGEARTGVEAVDAVRQHDPDVVVMDVRMPELDGIEATRQIASAGAAARVLMVTTFDLDEYVYAAMKAGASGFLLKDARREQLVNAIRTVAHGDQLLAPSITRRLIEDFCGQPDPDPAVRERFSPRELDVIGLIARGMSNAEIAGELFVAETTVKSHVARILTKLDLRDRVQVVVYRLRVGPRPSGPEPRSLTTRSTSPMDVDHRQLGVDLFNATWTLLDKPDRTHDEDEAMVHTAHASRFHWSQASHEAKHQARGEWQLSRVYAVLGRGEPAVHHAGECIEWCGRGDVEDWDIAFAYESMSRACAVAGDADSAAMFKRLAREAGDAIADPEDRVQFERDYATL